MTWGVWKKEIRERVHLLGGKEHEPMGHFSKNIRVKEEKKSKTTGEFEAVKDRKNCV